MDILKYFSILIQISTIKMKISVGVRIFKDACLIFKALTRRKQVAHEALCVVLCTLKLLQG